MLEAIAALDVNILRLFVVGRVRCTARAGGPHGGFLEDPRRGGLGEGSDRVRTRMGHRHRRHRVSRTGKHTYKGSYTCTRGVCAFPVATPFKHDCCECLLVAPQRRGGDVVGCPCKAHRQ